ncbi:hypothetical protein RI543_001477 [Arxiozyma heterogenica]|uniref:Inheritance of peroxisomes protein 2 n=1 Tax=Arxiozyma heterogenica TaxID=278026 RepID=A0AAN7W4K6_9SACH|nr:hypothetical protein RI543_001477 [Kazachstania heterogenica]
MVSQLFELPELQIFIPNENHSTLKQLFKNTVTIDTMKNYKESDYLLQCNSSSRSSDFFPNKLNASFSKSKLVKRPRTVKYRCVRKQIRQIENLLLLSQNDYEQFNDVFRYPIVSSHILNDYSSYFQNVQMKKSIPNLKEHTIIKTKLSLGDFFNEKNCEKITNSHLNGLLLKYYRILILFKDWNFSIDIKLQYFLLLSKAFNIIYSKKRQILKTIKCKLMIILKEFLNKLENCDMVIHKFLLNYKTLQTYNIFDQESFLKQNSHDKNNCGANIHDHNTSNNNSFLSIFIKNLLKSHLDQFFYIFRYELELILPLTDENSLSKYIEIYGIKLSDLKYYLNTDIQHLNEKAYRVTITQKFFLCCLLSISFHERTNKDKNNRNTELYYIFNINFLDKNYCYSTSNDKIGSVLKQYESLTGILHGLSMSLESISNSLINYKNFLNLETEATLNNTYINNEVTDELFEVTKLVNELDSKLTFLKDDIFKYCNNNDQNKVLMNKLQHLLFTIHDTLNFENSIYNYSSKPNQQVKRIVSAPMNKSNRGFSLDIVKHNLDIYSNLYQSDSSKASKINLSNESEFTHIHTKSMSNNIENVSEMTHTTKSNSVFYNDENEDTCVPSDLSTPIQSPTIYGKVLSKINITHNQNHDNDRKLYHYESLQKLSDEELRHKLNEKIINFANENKLGKNKLRAQKSFELLKKQQNKKTQTFPSTILSFSTYPKNLYSKKNTNVVNQDNTNVNNGRTISNSFSTEDTIPIIYEIKELIEY